MISKRSGQQQLHQQPGGSEGGCCSFSDPGQLRLGVACTFSTRRAIIGLPCDANTGLCIRARTLSRAAS